LYKKDNLVIIMNGSSGDTSYFSSICIEQCKGLCCDPWWGIISYNVVKEGWLSNLKSFRDELVKGIKIREQRIVDGYVTREVLPRPLFKRPEKYNVSIREIKPSGNSLLLNVMAMFAFRCLYISPEKVCTIHPSRTGGEDIRPPHCGYMGSLNVRPGEKGYCRIIHAAESRAEEDRAVNEAIEVEKDSSERHYSGGVTTAEAAADHMIGELKDYCERHTDGRSLVGKKQVVGRNEPCHCGSGIKYKKCHGR